MIAAPTVCAATAATIQLARFGAQMRDPVAVTYTRGKEGGCGLERRGLEAGEAQAQGAVLDRRGLAHHAGRAREDTGIVRSSASIEFISQQPL